MVTNIILPTGYELVDPGSIAAEEIMALRNSVGWKTGTHAEWIACLNGSLHVSGVRDEKGTLVAISFLAGNLRHAILCDLCVHPDHQRRGLARALLFHRLARADELKIPFLYTSLSADNHLREKYLELGFKQTGGEYFWEREF